MWRGIFSGSTFSVPRLGYGVFALTLLLLGLFHESIFSCPSPAPVEKGYLEAGLFPHEIPHTPKSLSGSASTAGAAKVGYSQPASKEQQWFNIKVSGGFQQEPLVNVALTPPPAAQCHSKWIVVTTINAPTPTIEKLATLKDWRVVVVGDTKTPKDWAYPGITYLSVEAQLSLGFSVTQLLRTRSCA